jgi:N-acylneuraminate cytidylyltransferase
MESPEFYSSRSQDLKTLFHDAGQWYWINLDSFLKQKKLFMLKSHGIVLNDLEVQDIDSLIDFKLAELKYSELFKSIKI